MKKQQKKGHRLNILVTQVVKNMSLLAQAFCKHVKHIYSDNKDGQVLESCKQGCGLESENARVSEKTNGTWLQLVRSCALLTVL